MKWTNLVGDKGAAATLAGALFGAAAIFLGTEINDWNRRREAKAELEESRRQIRSALAPEFARVCVNLIGYSDGLENLRTWLGTELKNGKKKKVLLPPGMTMNGFIPPAAPWFEKLHLKALCLPEPEIEALSNFYGNLDSTRLTMQAIDSLSPDEKEVEQQIATFDLVISRYRANLEDALIAATLSWPERKMDSFSGKDVLVVAEIRSAIKKLKHAAAPQW